MCSTTSIMDRNVYFIPWRIRIQKQMYINCSLHYIFLWVRVSQKQIVRWMLPEQRENNDFGTTVSLNSLKVNSPGNVYRELHGYDICILKAFS